MDRLCHQAERIYFLRIKGTHSYVDCTQMRIFLELLPTPMIVCTIHGKWVPPGWSAGCIYWAFSRRLLGSHDVLVHRYTVLVNA